MLFEIKPVALKAMVTAVVVDVALSSVRSVSSDAVDALVIDEKDAAIGCVINVGRLSRFPGIELAGSTFISTNEDDDGGFVAHSNAKPVWS